jgi:hypothetical protein
VIPPLNDHTNGNPVSLIIAPGAYEGGFLKATDYTAMASAIQIAYEGTSLVIDITFLASYSWHHEDLYYLETFLTW